MLHGNGAIPGACRPGDSIWAGRPGVARSRFSGIGCASDAEIEFSAKSLVVFANER